MKLNSIIAFFMLASTASYGQERFSVKSPDQKTEVIITLVNGSPKYSVQHSKVQILENSPLGIISSLGDFSTNLRLVSNSKKVIRDQYHLGKSKASHINYVANQCRYILVNKAKDTMSIIFQVSDNNIAFQYILNENRKKGMECIIEKEITGFKLPEKATSFITPQAPPMTGYEKTKPSYEERYTVEEPVGTKSKYGLGYTFPALFHLKNQKWLLISETGVSGDYAGTKLSEASSDNLYRVSFPEIGENNGVGTNTVKGKLPMSTSWKTLTFGDDLAPIVENTISTDVVSPLVKSKKVFQPGRASWSWIIWQDPSCNFEDQVKYIDLAATLKCEYILIDALWDVQIVRKKMAELVEYAKTKHVGVLLWYNSNGQWNSAPQSPKNLMDKREARQKEMEWLESIGVKGLKIDFFGGDKQLTMQLYHDILIDAAQHGLSINFHGTTLPRGWERMYPSFMTSEAVLASENLVFSQEFSDNYPSIATIYPFTRNAVAAMDFGPVFLNQRLDRTNKKGTLRKTTDAFEMATAVVFFSPIQHWGLTPDNLIEKPSFLFDYLKNVPTDWDETKLLDGYPGKFCIIARRKGAKWYLAGINGENSPRKVRLDLKMFKNQKISIISDGQDGQAAYSEKKVADKEILEIQLAPNGGFIATSK